MDLPASLIAFCGHTAICVWLFNRLHAMPWPCRVIRLLERAILLFAAVVLVIYAARWLVTGVCVYAGEPLTAVQGAWLIYSLASLAAAIAAVPLWAIPKALARTPAALQSNHTSRVDLVEKLGSRPVGTQLTAMLAAVPGNEIFTLAVQTKHVRLSGLPAALAGLRVAHLSDLHMTGRFTREFYEEIVEQTNALRPDVIALTGDVCEKEKCLDWIVPVLGKLNAPQGKFFVLGNHETRLPDAAPLRRLLADAGFIDLAGRWIEHTIAGTAVVLAGNELPWIGDAPNMAGAPAGRLRILLSHTPDQFFWAQREGFQLMLAGHNHGGQIRLPLIGPLITPSRYGSRYASGLYHEGPTLLHVTRGIAGVHPVRFNCPPELALLVLEP
ncbi:MAG TPA: metallophosphoesterase [Pirellulaceae bacterium]|nr:metallophosphoesterase [Pirellulaceae bacterium]